MGDDLAELAGGEAGLRDGFPLCSVSELQSVDDQSHSRDDGPDQLVGSSPVLLEPTHELNLPTSLLAGPIQDLELEDFELDSFMNVPLVESSSSDSDSFVLSNSSTEEEVNSLLPGSEPDVIQFLDSTGQMPQLSWDLEYLLANC